MLAWVSAEVSHAWGITLAKGFSKGCASVLVSKEARFLRNQRRDIERSSRFKTMEETAPMVFVRKRTNPLLGASE